MILPRFDFEAPTRLTDACELLAEAGPEVAVLAGGTDLLVKIKRGELRPRLVVSLSGLDGLAGVEATEAGITLGPLTVMSWIEASPILGAPWDSLTEGAGCVGGPIIRNRATVGGNIISARPCADTVPPLMVLGATLELQSVRGARTVALKEFIAGPGDIRMAPDELLTAIHLPWPGGVRGRAGSCYLTVHRRAAMEVTLTGCAACVVLGEDDRVTRARVVLTSVAPVPLRVPEVEEVLEGRPPGEENIAAAAAAARRRAAPIDDHRAPAEYRSEMVEVLTRRALAAAVERARTGGRSR